MTRIVLLSDTHSKHLSLSVPMGDILIHCGDAMMSGTLKEFSGFVNWFRGLPHPYKIYVPGNHDFCVEKDTALCRNILSDGNPNIHLLIDQMVEIKGLKIYGSPWVPNLPDWAFYGDNGKLKEKFKAIPGETEILVTHGPPSGILDYIPGAQLFGAPSSDEYEDDWGLHVGSKAFRKRVDELPNLRFNFFGHIHESYRKWHVGNKVFVNASNCNGSYNPSNPPIIVDI